MSYVSTEVNDLQAIKIWDIAEMFEKTNSSMKSMGEITKIWEYEIKEGLFTHFDDCICILLNLKFELF